MSKVGLRKLWFQVHKWIGLILAVLIIPISLTGSALVWHESVEEAMHPERHVAASAALSPAAYADAARAALGKGEVLTRIELPKSGAVIASASKTGGGRPQRITLYLDPRDGHVIDTERSGEGFFQIIHQLHGSLLVPGTGRTIVGWVGVAMLVSSLTGLWLWWPLSGSVRRGFRWKRHANTDTNLHHMVGFWVSLPLFVLSLSGVWISFPPVFAGFDGGQGGPAPGRPKPIESPVTPIATVVGNAQAAAQGRVGAVSWPTDQKPVWTVDIAPDRGSRVSVAVMDSDGSAKVSPARAQPQTWARTMRGIHDGTTMPFIWQLIIFLGGIIPAILAVTGIIMWWRARGWRSEVAERLRTS